jgi:excinuclease ABC, B subunit
MTEKRKLEFGSRNRDSPLFKIVSDMTPKGSQPNAIAQLAEGVERGDQSQTLLGVTGSGKTYTIANVIEKVQRPTLVIAHNKTLAAQLYNEFKEFFPENRVEYFVSYYDYYQPESYIPAKDQYIEKDSQINPQIEQMRLEATASLVSRRDVIVVASVSCIYGLGNPERFEQMGIEVVVGKKMKRNDLIAKLVDSQFERNDLDLAPGRFRVKGDTIDVMPGYYKNLIRVEFFGNEIDKISEIDGLNATKNFDMDSFFIYPARHYVVPEHEVDRAIHAIMEELEDRLPELDLLESHRLKQKTNYDMEMIRETGSCKGIENYSMHFDGRKPGEQPYCLIDYFPDDFLLVIDESHQTLPQVHGMYNGDRARKKSLIDYGFRLPSAFDNRPLQFDEFEKYMNHTIFVSATPGDYEIKKSAQVVEQVIRPTGLVDPIVEIRPIKGQVDDIIAEIHKVIANGDRALVTTLTKRLAEELTEYLAEAGIKTRYLHSDIKTIERTEIIRNLRLGNFDVLVGINLLREGLDIPEVGFIGILDADKEGFLRDSRSLIQIIGRAARNSNSKVVLYADKMTGSIKSAMEETERRRMLQMEFNVKNGITPQTIRKPIREQVAEISDVKYVPKAEIPSLIIQYEAEMNLAAEMLDFERAIQMRDIVRDLERKLRGEFDEERELKEQKEKEKKEQAKKDKAQVKKDQKKADSSKK